MHKCDAAECALKATQSVHLDDPRRCFIKESAGRRPHAQKLYGRMYTSNSPLASTGWEARCGSPGADRVVRTCAWATKARRIWSWATKLGQTWARAGQSGRKTPSLRGAVSDSKRRGQTAGKAAEKVLLPRPESIASPVGNSTCASRRAGVCRNIDLCKSRGG